MTFHYMSSILTNIIDVHSLMFQCFGKSIVQGIQFVCTKLIFVVAIVEKLRTNEGKKKYVHVVYNKEELDPF